MFEELFRQHRAERMETNLLALGRLHTEHELGRRLREMKERGEIYAGGNRALKLGRLTLNAIGFDYPNGKHDSADFQRRDG